LRSGHTTQQQADRHDRKNRQQAIKGIQPRAREFAQHHVVALQIVEKQQAQRAFPLLLAKAVRRQQRAREQA
jgi:hypothetical protein